MTKEIIYVGGDSFTAGDDMGDYILPKFESWHSLKEIRNIESNYEVRKQWFDYREQLLTSDHDLYRQYRSLALETRWSSVLEKILEKPVVNFSSLGGSSMFSILYRAINDINYLRNTGHVITDAIIQLTGAMRYTYFTLNPKDIYENQLNYYIDTVNLGSSEVNSLPEVFYSYEYDQAARFRQFYEIYQTEIMLTQLLGKPPIFVDSMFFKQDIYGKIPIKEYQNHSDENFFLNHYIKELENKIKLSMIEMIQNEDEQVWSTTVHLNSTIHQRFAEQIAKEYFSG